VNGDFRIGPWLVHPSLNAISQNGASTRLEPKVMEVLVCLAEHTGEVISKEKLLQTVWPDTFVTDDVLKRSVSELRRALKDDARESRIIQTIPKRGYRLLAPVERGFGVEVSYSPECIDGAAEVRTAHRRKFWLALGLSGSVALLLLGLLFNLGDARDWLRGKHVPLIRPLAVLPLKSLSDDPKQEYFADGVTDALITDLAQIRALRIVSRTTALRYKDTREPLPKIARELKCGWNRGRDGAAVGRSCAHYRAAYLWACRPAPLGEQF
jgi:adenylate cyclase